MDSSGARTCLRGHRSHTPALLLAALASLLLAAPASALSVAYRFEAITANDAANVAAGERQLRMRVFDSGSSGADVDLFFDADGRPPGSGPPEPLSITGIRLVDPVGILELDLLTLVHVVPFPGDEVMLQGGPDPGTPANDFVLSSYGPKGAVYHGIQPGEVAPLLVTTLDHGLDIAGLSGVELFLALLDRDPLVGSVDVRLTVEGFADGGTETFQLAPLPEPASGGVLSLGALALLGLRRRARHP